jgi:hypothetical protein
MTAEYNRYHKGQRTNFTFRRDPLAVRFDTAAAKLVKRAIDARGGWVSVLVASPEAERDDLDQDGLTHHERAFLQACYYHRLIYLHGPGYWTDENGRQHQNPNPDRRYALKRRWGDGVREQGRFLGRDLFVRVVRVGEASVHAWDHGHTR